MQAACTVDLLTFAAYNWLGPMSPTVAAYTNSLDIVCTKENWFIEQMMLYTSKSI